VIGAAVYLPLVLPVIVALAAWPVAVRLAPGLATWLLTASSVVLAAATGAALGVLVIAGALHVPQVAALGHVSLQALRGGDLASSVPMAVVAGLTLLAAAAAALRAAWRRARALVAAGHAAACLPAGQLAVIDDERADAFAVPGLTGRQGRVVVSTGMLAVLDQAQRSALVAHERAHLAGRHHLFVAAAHLAAAANPLLRPAERAVAYTVERWADERAAEVTGDRRMTALAVGNAALAKARRPPSKAGTARVSSTACDTASTVTGNPGVTSTAGAVRSARGRGDRLGTRARRAPARCAPQPTIGPSRAAHRARADSRAADLAHAGPVPRRVAALLDPRPRLWRRRIVLAAAVVAIAVTSVAAVGEAAADLHNVVETAQSALGRGAPR
jgi:Zn-dependent protease with chaperone function